MAYKDLQDFINILEQQGLLCRIKTEVDPCLEIAEITDRICKEAGPALLFENVKGYSMPVAINLFGSMERMTMALEVNSLDDIAKKLKGIVEPEIPSNLFEKLKLLPKLKRLADFIPKEVSRGACHDIVITADAASLDMLPILTTWPQDGGPFITLPVVITKDPVTGIRNAGMYRMQKFDSKTTGMHWHIHKHGAKHYRESSKAGKQIETAVVLGGDPAVIYSATAPLPEGVDEMVFAGFLRNEPVELVKCKTVELEVPANAEIILEGYVNPHELRCEGPFGDHTGYYSLADNYPVFHLKAITMKKNPIYPATIVGKPPMEDCFLGKATERIFLPLLQKILPEVIDINLPVEGIFHNFCFVKIRKDYPGQAQRVMHGIWGLGLMMFTKIIAVFDEDVNIQDMPEVIWRIGNNIDPKRDITFVEGPVDALEHASPIPHFGSKMGIDATRKRRSDGFMRDWPDDIVMSDEIKALVDKKWKEYFSK